MWRFPYIIGQYGGAAFVLIYLLMMFYTTIGGWMLLYFVKMAGGRFEGLNAEQIAGEFGALTQKPVLMSVCMVLVVALCFGICSKGLHKGVSCIKENSIYC